MIKKVHNWEIDKIVEKVVGTQKFNTIMQQEWQQQQQDLHMF